MSTESELLAERVGTLTAENKALTELVEVEKNQKRVMYLKLMWERLWIAPCVLLLVLALIAASGYPFVMWLTASSTPTHCVVRSSDFGLFKLNGVVPWRSPVTIGRFANIPDALQAVDDIQCDVIGSGGR